LLIEIIQTWFVEYPNPDGQYNFSVKEPNMSGHENQSMIVDEILGKIENGFFVECNANDGEVNSNSLFFEMKRNWTGILIEPNQEAFAELGKKNRKVN
jgi:hypothetical protein